MDSTKPPVGTPGRGRRAGRGSRTDVHKAGLTAVFAYFPVAFLAIFAGVPIVFSLLLVLGHLQGPNAALSLLGQGEIAANGLVTFRPISELLRDSDFQANVVATVVVVVISSAVVLVSASTLTLWHRLRPSRATAVLQFLSVVPLFIPVVIASFALWTFWGDRGFANSLGALAGLHRAFIYSASLKGVVIAQVWVSLPFAVLLLRAGLVSMSDRSLDAARDVGAGPIRIATQIILPQLRTELVVAFCFTAVAVLGSFTVPYIIGPAKPLMLGVDAVDTFTSFNEPQQAAIIGFTIFAIAAMIGCFYALSQRRGRVSAV
jgi:ABC-type spermidine/putrescine transport system permease subunit I